MEQQVLVIFSQLVAISIAASSEWPVYFEHLGLIHSIHNKWDLSLNTALHLPKLESRILKSIHRLRLLSGQYNEEAEAHFRSSEEKSRLEELQESWDKLNRQLSRRAENLRRRTKSLKALGTFWAQISKKSSNSQFQFWPLFAGLKIKF